VVEFDARNGIRVLVLVNGVLALRTGVPDLDLVIKATWPAHAGHTNALRIQATRGPEPLTDTTLWGDPDLADVVTLPGPTTP
jgi:hypothetical protein